MESIADTHRLGHNQQTKFAIFYSPNKPLISTPEEGPFSKPVHIKTVGIKNVRYPVRVRQQKGGRQDTVASISLQADMPSSHRENCVSEFIAILNRFQDDLSVTIFSDHDDDLCALGDHIVDLVKMALFKPSFD